MKQLWSELPALDDMPYYSTRTEAGVALLKEVRERLLESPKMRDPNKLLDIAGPITSKMTQLRPSLSNYFESRLSIKYSSIVNLISFIGSMLLHVIVWLYHRYKHRHPTTPLWCGLFCPERLKATRPNSCSEAALVYSDYLSPVHVSSLDYSAKVRTLSRAQSEQSLRALSNPNLASYQEVTSTAPPVENVQNIGNFSRELNA